MPFCNFFPDPVCKIAWNTDYSCWFIKAPLAHPYSVSILSKQKSAFQNLTSVNDKFFTHL